MRTLRTTFMIGAILALAGTAFAHSLTGPAVVQADGAGHFAYELTLVVDSATELGYAEWSGTENTDLEWTHVDGFCATPHEIGTFMIPMEGNLLHPEMGAAAMYVYALCDGWTGEVHTDILAPTVAAEHETWAAVKRIYR
ncbi:MAG: hypothetical protein R6X25_15220 [Candidatus Krumholzibacteriia bacterium]